MIRRLLFLFLLLIGGLVVALGIAAVVVFFVIDPDRYRPAIEQAVERSSEYRLEIGGEIDWTFRPVFGLTLRGVRLSNPEARQELASFSEVSVSVAPWRLLGGELIVEDVLARDLNLNWFVDESGRNNWLTGTANDASTPSSGSEGLPVSVNIQRIDIRNTQLAVRDLQRGIDMRLEDLNIDSRNTNLSGTPFPLQITTRLLDYTGDRDLRVNLSTQAAVDFNAGDVALEELRFNLSPMVLSGQLALSDFRNEARFQGELESNQFNLLYLLETLTGYNAGPGLDMDDNSFRMSTRFDGDARGATVEQLDLTLDDMTASITGDLLYPTAQRPLSLAWQLEAGELDLDPWLTPPDSEAGAATGDTASTAPDPSAPAPTDAEAPAELPLDLLDSIVARGTHRIESLRAYGLEFSAVDARLIVEGGELDLQLEPVGFHGGELAGRFQVNANVTPARLDSRVTAENINAPGLAQRFPLLAPFEGRLDLDAEHAASGATVPELLDGLSGLTRFSMSDGSADITMIKRVFDAISVLSPDGDMAGNWPDRVDFATLQGQWLLDNGLAEGQQLSLRMDNLDIAGEGGLDLAGQRFDYRMDFTVLGEPAPQMIRIAPDYQNIAWPVRCEAAFDARPLQYCSPDLQRVRELFTRIARDEVERRARDAFSEEVDQLQERARGLLDRLGQ